MHLFVKKVKDHLTRVEFLPEKIVPFPLFVFRCTYLENIDASLDMENQRDMNEHNQSVYTISSDSGSVLNESDLSNNVVLSSLSDINTSSINDSVFDSSAIIISEDESKEVVTQSVSDASVPFLQRRRPDTPLTYALNTSGKRFERGLGLNNINNDLIKLNTVSPENHSSG